MFRISKMGARAWRKRAIAYVAASLGACGLWACGGNDPQETPAGPAAVQQARNDPRQPTRDWANEPLSVAHGELDGFSYSVKLPPLLKRKLARGDDKHSSVANYIGTNPFFDPSFRVSMTLDPPYAPKDVNAAAVGMSKRNPPLEVARKKKFGDGGFMVSVIDPDDSSVRVKTWRPVDGDDRMLTIDAKIRTVDADDLDEVRPWLETIAGSFRAE